MNRFTVAHLGVDLGDELAAAAGEVNGQAIADVLASRCVYECRCRDVIDTEEA
jgi:hypothetical protein